MLRLIPAIFIVISFLTICFGVYLKSTGHAMANFVIVSGLLGELIFILFNRWLMSQNGKDNK